MKSIILYLIFQVWFNFVARPWLHFSRIDWIKLWTRKFLYIEIVFFSSPFGFFNTFKVISWNGKNIEMEKKIERNCTDEIERNCTVRIERNCSVRIERNCTDGIERKTKKITYVSVMFNHVYKITHILRKCI